MGRIIWDYRRFHTPYPFTENEILQRYIECDAEVFEGKSAFVVAKLRDDFADVVFNVLPK